MNLALAPFAKAAKRSLALLLLAGALLLIGCNPASRAREWAQSADSGQWRAKYSLFFHQKDGDLRMDVLETRGETLMLDIQSPRGRLKLEFDETSMALSLDSGQLEWEEALSQIPYYSLTELAKKLVGSQTGSSDIRIEGEWAEIQGYRLRLKGGTPAEVEYLGEWTLQVEEFIWD